MPVARRPWASLLLLLAVVAGVRPARPSASAESKQPEPADSQVRSFLAQAGPLLSQRERDAYLALQRSYQRSAFEKRFWQLRDPYPETPANEFADRWLERAPQALERFGSLDDARGLAWAAAGEPADSIKVACGDLLRPLEIWRYAGAGRIRSHFVLVFVAEGFGAGGRYRAWNPREGLSALAISGNAAGDARQQQMLLGRIAERCTRGSDAAALLQVAIDWEQLAAKAALIPQPNDEWVRSFSVYSTDLPQNARTLAARLEVAFTGRRGLRTLVQGAIRLQGASANGTYTLDGEVLREGDLFEHFRYRFRPPADAAVPFVFERPLRPGHYRLVLKLHDLDDDRYYREERALDVPAAPSLVAARPATPTAAPPAPTGDVAAPVSSEPSLRLFVPSDRLLTGKLRVEAATRGEGIAAVAFSLDGKPVLRKMRPPFDVELDLGRELRLHRVGATALAADGSALASDEALVNGGPHRFALRLLEPRSIPAAAERVHALAQVDLPEGESLDRVEFYVNDALYATLYQPPFEQSLPIPRGAEVAWIRAVAHLADGGAAEDVRLIGAGEMSAAVDVDFVELYATFLDRRGHPIDDLAAGEVTVTEDGKPQEIRRFEHVADLPIHAGVLLDTSSSMAEELADAEQAALRFFSEVLTDRDRAAVITFSDQPHLAARFTRSVEVLAGGLAHLEADGETALWDALAYALHYFSGIRGKRALVLISDGLDSHSKFDYEEVLEYARRTGVAIYAIGLHVPSRPPEVGMLLDRLARETGGRSYRIDRAQQLGPIYREIQGELRSQYLIAYQSSGEGDDFREVRLDCNRPGVDVRTVSGYYP